MARPNRIICRAASPVTPVGGRVRRRSVEEGDNVNFERLFNPRAIAVIGASGDLTRISGQPIQALRNSGFKGAVHLVNPRYKELHGQTCYPAAKDIGQPVDLAVIAVPAAGVPAAIRDCGQAGNGEQRLA